MFKRISILIVLVLCFICSCENDNSTTIEGQTIEFGYTATIKGSALTLGKSDSPEMLMEKYKDFIKVCKNKGYNYILVYPSNDGKDLNYYGCSLDKNLSATDLLTTVSKIGKMFGYTEYNMFSVDQQASNNY